MSDEEPTIPLDGGNRIRIIAGTFEGFEAVVTNVDETAGKVFAEIWIFGKATPVELSRHDAVQIPRRERP